MKKYVAPMSCVLSVKMDENIAASAFRVPTGTEYVVVGGKIQNTPLKYTDAFGNANNIIASVVEWMGMFDVKTLTGYLADMSTTCYAGEDEPDYIEIPIG